MSGIPPGAPGRAAVLCGVGGRLPERVVSNAELSARLETTDEWITTRTGIRNRRAAAPGEATSDLAVAAGRRALDAAGGEPADTVLVATVTPDRRCPATAPLVAARLGLTGAAAFDVSAVCTGFLYGLATAAGLIAAGVSTRVLLIGADVYSSVVDPTDRTNAIIFGDGAGAVVLRAGSPDEPGAVGHFDLGSDGGAEEAILIAAGGSRSPLTAQTPRADRHFAMRGKEVYRQAVTRMTASARTTLAAAGWHPDDVDHLVAHQANLRILHSVADGLGVARERCARHLVDVGNTGAASIPLALDDAHATGALTPGARVLLTGFGGGLTWGSCALRWPDLSPATDR
ncbi:beta-ketoacyl-ACP synthase III [Streptomyces catenulae]|uniref:Beta-ketoacyl-[acyl-carrier-protein] synthase III n=1 Tax=Streptomyces catenulae TaxID=66875 RepID=A0ABV2Z673_9ACTN|nr:beta-ketoacyl-ACP synthase III [Streptomyces catenulae]